MKTILLYTGFFILKVPSNIRLLNANCVKYRPMSNFIHQSASKRAGSAVFIENFNLKKKHDTGINLINLQLVCAV